MLDLAKIEAGKQDIDFEPVSLDALRRHARRVFEPLAADKGLELTVEIAPDSPEAIVTDRQRVEHILTNLLGNADQVHRTRRGRASYRAPGARHAFSARTISIRARPIAFAVSDTGIGIAAEAQERVFAPFEQLEAQTDRRYGGTGLGLGIARESVELLGGELAARQHARSGQHLHLLPAPAAGPGNRRTASSTRWFRSAARDVPDDRATWTLETRTCW